MGILTCQKHCWPALLTGVEATLRAAVGMFAFCPVGSHTSNPDLGTRPSGRKTLFYGWHGDAMLFASELKALAAWWVGRPSLIAMR